MRKEVGFYETGVARKIGNYWMQPIIIIIIERDSERHTVGVITPTVYILSQLVKEREKNHDFLLEFELCYFRNVFADSFSCSSKLCLCREL